jgi:hypothetical protein
VFCQLLLDIQYIPDRTLKKLPDSRSPTKINELHWTNTVIVRDRWPSVGFVGYLLLQAFDLEARKDSI